MPHDLALKAMNTIHRGILALSGGRLGWEADNMPVLELTTTGRKSGQPRSIMLTSPVQDGSTYVIVASRGGEDHHPAWFLNLQADPKVEVRWKGAPKEPMQARIVTGDERADLWKRVVAANKRYQGYQDKTEREIPLVCLEPVAG
jgi:deazaflavin-dependent oxidoreductase (nitroreductase family)